MNDGLLTTALQVGPFLAGLLSTGHCIGMCGGLVTAFSLSAPGRVGGIVFNLLYHTGRLTTYVGLGWLAGMLGSTLTMQNTISAVARPVLIATDIFVILLGMGTMGLFKSLNVFRLEKGSFTGPLTRLAGLARAIPGPLAGLPLGLVFGFMPCGIVYVMLLVAAQTTQGAQGASVMLRFGLGTVPALLALGLTAHRLRGVRLAWMLQVAGLLVALMGAIQLYRHLLL